MTVLISVLLYMQGAFVGMLSSLILTMWIGFGQTVAKNYGTYSVPTKETTVAGCPPEWMNFTSTTTTTESPLNGTDLTDMMGYCIVYHNTTWPYALHLLTIWFCTYVSSGTLPLVSPIWVCMRYPTCGFLPLHAWLALSLVLWSALWPDHKTPAKSTQIWSVQCSRSSSNGGPNLWGTISTTLI